MIIVKKSYKKFINSNEIKLIEAIVYVFAIIVSIFCIVYGPIYLKMLPLLIVIGIVGRILFKRSITTTVFGIIVSIIMLFLGGQLRFIEIVFNSFVYGLCIGLGELLGKYIYISYTFFKNERKKKSPRAKKSYIITFLIFCITIIVQIYFFGNILEYNKSRTNLEKYLSDTYKEESGDFKIINASCIFFPEKVYVFKVLKTDESNKYNFSVYSNDSLLIRDGYKEYIYYTRTIELSDFFDSYLKSKNFNEKYKDIKISAAFSEDYSIMFNIEKDVEVVSVEEKNIYSTELVEIIGELIKFDKYPLDGNINVILKSQKDQKNNVKANIVIKDYINNIEIKKQDSSSYILNSFSLEFFDVKN